MKHKIYSTITKLLKELWKQPETVWNLATFLTLKDNGFKTSKIEFCNRVDNKTSYENLGLAIKHCQRNDECLGIYDDDCDAFGHLKLCKDVRKISDGVILGSCIYKKGPGKSTIISILRDENINIITDVK